jgi:inhibitor of KinA sporulation pathway (predicted exonuclease)
VWAIREVARYEPRLLAPMTIRHDQVLVVDIEATCWQDHKPPQGELSEIIEVGVCLLDTRTFEPSQPMGILVKPEHSKVSPFCTQLTTLTQAMLDEQGITFAEACAMLEKIYGSCGVLWGSWGNYDKRMFVEQCKTRNIRYPYSDYHMNIRKMYAKWEKHKHLSGMPLAMQDIGLTLEGTHHRGVDDAWNIARILGALLQKHGVGILAKYW